MAFNGNGVEAEKNGNNNHLSLTEFGNILDPDCSNGITDGAIEGTYTKILTVEVETETRKPLIYRINDVPPFHLTVVFALQQSLLVIASPLTMTLLVAEVACMQNDESLKLQVLSSLMFIVGISTFIMTTFGVRLPVFQGPGKSYIFPLVAMTSLTEWRCPVTSQEFDPTTNTTMLMATNWDNTTVPARDVAIGKLAVLSGSLMAAGAIHFLIGITGLVGILCRYVGPITIVPTIVLIGLNTFKVVVKFIQPNIGIAMIVVFCNLLFSILLGNKQTPIPWWNKQKGFHIFWYPLHQVFSLLISILIAWAVSAILTVSGSLTDDPDSKEFLARTDARDYIVEQSDWFMIPYPGKFAGIDISLDVFTNFFIASILSVLDSIGDYAATAKMARVTPPPPFAFNRGIAVEGFLSLIGGAMGACIATVSFGANIGAMGITRVVSRRVFQFVGVFFVIFSVIGKVGAFFISIPYPVLGGTTLVTIGIFVGVVLSYLQTIDLSSTRNLAIIGIALLSGMVMPYWVSQNADMIDTGNKTCDVIIQVMLSNPSFISAVFSCTMDNLAPGTLKERGLLAQMKDLDDDEAKDMALKYEDGPEVYRLPFLPNKWRHSKFAKLCKIFYTEDVN